MLRARFRLAAMALILSGVAFSDPARAKQPVERADQLPSHSYAVSKAPSALLHDGAGFDALVDSLRRDLEADLEAYDIRDATTLRAYFRALSTIALLRHRPDQALAYEDQARPLEEKPAARLLSGLTLRPLVAAEKAGPSGAAQAFSSALASLLAGLPYDSVQTELRSRRDILSAISPAYLEGRVASEIDVAAKNGRISKDMALQLLNRAFTLQRVLPHREELVRQMSAWLDAHHVDKADIWPTRDVTLEGRHPLTPVVIAIWDTGVDLSLFPGRLWTNAKETPSNGKDDDRNGYVDDVHGIAWSWQGEPRTGDLRELELSPPDLDLAKQNIGGFQDIQAGIDSPEARKVRERLAGLGKDDVKPLIESVIFYTTYAHGTHVAGIVAHGNPAVRMLSTRFEAPYRMVPPPPDATWATGFARSVRRTVAYDRKAGVRIVNLSWGISSAELEHDLEMNGVGSTPEQRHAIAVQSYDTVKTALRTSFSNAPRMLFVCAAGNSDNSNQFDESVPASLDLPNTITVGAVDQAGDEASFTSYGKVDLYASGSSVESVLPGGTKARWSGTSMAAPQVVNLAAKLLAVDPSLDPTRLKKLILDGADAKALPGGRSIRLLNEKRSFELARAAANR